eukprot:scaffold122_cov236-Pinguiococcus_pyrenoidosus.AAC.8
MQSNPIHISSESKSTNPLLRLAPPLRGLKGASAGMSDAELVGVPTLADYFILHRRSKGRLPSSAYQRLLASLWSRRELQEAKRRILFARGRKRRIELLAALPRRSPKSLPQSEIPRNAGAALVGKPLQLFCPDSGQRHAGRVVGARKRRRGWEHLVRFPSQPGPRTLREVVAWREEESREIEAELDMGEEEHEDFDVVIEEHSEPPMELPSNRLDADLDLARQQDAVNTSASLPQANTAAKLEGAVRSDPALAAAEAEATGESQTQLDGPVDEGEAGIPLAEGEGREEGESAQARVQGSASPVDLSADQEASPPRVRDLLEWCVLEEHFCSVGQELVWGKITGYAWWPGQIHARSALELLRTRGIGDAAAAKPEPEGQALSDDSDASEEPAGPEENPSSSVQASKAPLKVHGNALVIFFGDSTFAELPRVGNLLSFQGRTNSARPRCRHHQSGLSSDVATMIHRQLSGAIRRLLPRQASRHQVGHVQSHSQGPREVRCPGRGSRQAVCRSYLLLAAERRGPSDRRWPQVRKNRGAASRLRAPGSSSSAPTRPILLCDRSDELRRALRLTRGSCTQMAAIWSRYPCGLAPEVPAVPRRLPRMSLRSLVELTAFLCCLLRARASVGETCVLGAPPALQEQWNRAVEEETQHSEKVVSKRLRLEAMERAAMKAPRAAGSDGDRGSADAARSRHLLGGVQPSGTAPLRFPVYRNLYTSSYLNLPFAESRAAHGGSRKRKRSRMGYRPGKTTVATRNLFQVLRKAENGEAYGGTLGSRSTVVPRGVGR